MSAVHSENIVTYFTGRPANVRATALFLKALYLITITKMIRLWVVSDVFFAAYRSSAPGSIPGKMLFFPYIIALDHVHVFFATGVLFLVIAMLMKPDYRINLIFFWLVLNLFKLKYPVINGSDFVLLVFSTLAIPLACKPIVNNIFFETAAVTLYNLSRLLSQIQVLVIYLISGWDKLNSPLWRSGDAFDYIMRIDVMFNPALAPVFMNPVSRVVLSWSTIIFELSFIVLVNIKRTRLFILCVGVVFHIGIWFMLALPDFAWMMIAVYVIFLRDSDLEWIRTKLRLPLP